MTGPVASPDKIWDCIHGLLTQIARSQDADATMAAVAMVYVCIDTLTFLSIPSSQTSQTRTDFIAWFDTYLKAESSQAYQYRGIYAARCGILHAFTAEADLHRKDLDIIMFGYADNGPHVFNPAVSPRLAIISVAVLVHDLAKAIQSFLEACKSDAALRARVESRLPMVYATLPFPQ
jgi:hypothetical protein